MHDSAVSLAITVVGMSTLAIIYFVSGSSPRFNRFTDWLFGGDDAKKRNRR
jgi:hypothetical protein